MKTIKIIFTLLVILHLGSCSKMSDTYDWFKRLGVQWSFEEKDKVYTKRGELKVQLKTNNGGRKAKEFSLFNVSGDVSTDMVADFAESKGILYLNGQKMTSGVPFEVRDEKELKFRFVPIGTDIGPIPLTFYTETEAEIRPSIYNLEIIKNEPPIAEFSWTKVNGLDYEFDLSTSRDQDDGGMIAGYQFLVTESLSTQFQDDISKSPEKIVSYRFPQPGTFEVKLVVVDSDGIKGTITKPITVE